MNRQPVIVGVDASPESVRAAVMGSVIGEKLGVPCIPVHAVAVADYLANLPPEISVNADVITQRAIVNERGLVRDSLHGKVPQSVVDALEVTTGRPSVAIGEAVRQHGAGLVIMGARKHEGLDRLIRSAVLHVLRSLDVPLLVTDGNAPPISRILVAVDLSQAAKPTLEAAQEWAQLFGARLRVVHAVEPVPIIAGAPILVGDEEFFRSEERLVGLDIRPLITWPDTEVVLRRGPAAGMIRDEVAAWGADLVVMGLHGRGWAHRLLLGSTTERMVHDPPAACLVVPVPGRARRPLLHGMRMPWEERHVAGAASV